MIRDCPAEDLEIVLDIINDGAGAYKGIIPDDRWHEPYMATIQLRAELDAGVAFRGWQDADGHLLGVMGAQVVADRLLIRHAYVRAAQRRKGFGSRLIEDLLARADRSVLIGTWAAADWAISFYEKHGFKKVSTIEKDRLLKTYWTISDRQIETSVVLSYDRGRE